MKNDDGIYHAMNDKLGVKLKSFTSRKEAERYVNQRIETRKELVTGGIDDKAYSVLKERR